MRFTAGAFLCAGILLGLEYLSVSALVPWMVEPRAYDLLDKLLDNLRGLMR